MNLRATTKMALQAAIAIAIAEIVSRYFDQGYWITLTAMVLTTQTWGESVKRGLERVGMTILGGSLGTALYFFLRADNQNLFVVLLLVFVFLTVYLKRINYLISMFFLTCFVVFLFALIGRWDWFLLRARIVDTALGTSIALLVSGFFLSRKTNLNDLLIGYLEKMNAYLLTIFQAEKQIGLQPFSQYLADDFRKIRLSAISTRYELLFHRLSQHDFFIIINQLGICTRYVINIIESYQWLSSHLNLTEHHLITAAARTTEKNIEVILEYLNNKQNPDHQDITHIAIPLDQAITVNFERFATLESDALSIYSIIYFFNRLNACLFEVYRILKQ